MSPGILGKKIGMTQVFRPDGQAVPVTLLKAGPCMVVQRKTPTTDGYDAVQLGLVEFVKPQRINKPATGHLKKAGVEGAKFLREFPLRPGDDDFKPGDKVLVDQFKPKDKVDVIGVSKGRGFAGVVKRHHFRGGEGYARLHVPPRAGFDRRVQLSRRACCPGMRMGGPHGQRAGDGAQPRGDRRGHRGQRAGGEGRGAGSQRRIRAGAEVQEVTAMPTVDVVDLNNQKVGEVELADEVFGAEVNEALLYEAVRHYQAGRARRHAQDQGAQRSGRFRQEAVEAEGHGPGARRLGPVADLASRRHGARPGAARLQLQAAAQDAVGRAALGAVGQGAGRRIEGGAGVPASADHKTKNAAGALAKLETGRTVLVVDNGENRNLELGMRNLQGVTAAGHARSQRLPPAGPRAACCCREAAARKFSEALAK